MTRLKILLIIAGLTLVACASKKQIYPDRLVDKNNRHVYVNDKLDFSIWYFDIISAYNRQTDKIDFKKTNVPVLFQKHLKKSVKRPSEILFQAHRTTMSDEDMLGVLYTNKDDLQGFSSKIIKDLATFIPKDSLEFQPYQTTSGYLINSKAYKEVKQLGSNFLQKRPFNTLTYKAKLDNREYKFHEFHVAFNTKTTLRFIWIADVQKTIVNSKLDWEKIDEQNHYIEFFHLTDSAKFHLKEVVPNDFHKLARETFKESGYMGAVQELKSYENTVETKGTEAQKEQFYQAMMVYQSFLGDHKASMNYHDKSIKPKAENVDANYFDGHESHDAAQFIPPKIENERVVIFNEAHNCGQQRAFMRDIIRGVYEKGFKHLALETLDVNNNINLKGYPLRIKSGYYSDEPTFGQMLREAKAVGFKLWAYEDTSACNPPTNCLDFREQQQAENLKTIMDKLPNEKLLIWVGHGHIYEATPQMDFKMMASYFKKKTGINPYTIEQTMFKETATETTDPAIWKAAMKKWQFKKPIVVTKKDSVFVFPPMQGIVDMQVFFPRTEYPNDYPNWMGNSETSFYEINIEKAFYRDRLLKIFIKKEYDKEIESAIPVMNIPLSARSPMDSKIGIFKLFLKPNKYVAVVRDGGNWEYLFKEFEVK